MAESQQHHGQHGHVEFQAGDPSMMSGRCQGKQNWSDIEHRMILEKLPRATMCFLQNIN